MTWLVVRRVAQVTGLAFAIAFLPQAAWADSGSSFAASGFSLGLEPSVSEAGVAPMSQEQAQAAVYAAGPTEVTLSPGQWDVLILVAGITIALSAASLVLGMRR